MALLLFLIAVEVAVLIHLYRINHPRVNRTKSIGVRFNPKGTGMADLSLNVGQSSTGTVTPFLVDGTTQTPGAVVTSATWSISDPSVSVATNADFTVTVTGVTATASPVSGSVTAVITDSDGTVWDIYYNFHHYRWWRTAGESDRFNRSQLERSNPLVGFNLLPMNVGPFAGIAIL